MRTTRDGDVLIVRVHPGGYDVLETVWDDRVEAAVEAANGRLTIKHRDDSEKTRRVLDKMGAALSEAMATIDAILGGQPGLGKARSFEKRSRELRKEMRRHASEQDDKRRRFAA